MAIQSRLTKSDLDYIKSLEEVISKRTRDPEMTFAQNIEQLRKYFGDMQAQMLQTMKEIRHPGRKTKFEEQILKNMEQYSQIISFLDQMIHQGIKLSQSKEAFRLFQTMVQHLDKNNLELDKIVKDDKSSAKYQDKVYKLFGKNLEKVSAMHNLTKDGVIVKDVKAGSFRTWWERSQEAGRETFFSNMKVLGTALATSIWGPLGGLWEDLKNFVVGAWKTSSDVFGWVRGKFGGGGAKNKEKVLYSDGLEEYFNKRALRSPFWKKLFDKLGIKTSGKTGEGFLANLGAAFGLNKLGGMLSNMFKGVGAAIVWLFTTPAGWITLAVIAVVAAIWLIIANWKKIVEWSKAAWGGIVQGWKNVISYVSRAWGGIVNAWHALLQGLKRAILAPFEFGKNLGTGIHNFVVNKIFGSKTSIGASTTKNIGDIVTTRASAVNYKNIATTAGIPTMTARPGEVYKNLATVRDQQRTVLREMSTSFVKSIDSMSKKIEKAIVNQGKRQESNMGGLRAASSVSDIPVMVDDLGLILLNTATV